MSTQLYPGIPFSPQATLTNNIGAADSIIEVSDISAFPPAPNLATIGTDGDGETILYTAKTGTALSGCQRGVEGTAKSWTAGELIGRNFTAKDHADLIAAVSETRDTAETAIQDAAQAKADAQTAADVAATAQGEAETASQAFTAHQAASDAHKTLFAAKQDKLTGTMGQLVSFGTNGDVNALTLTAESPVVATQAGDTLTLGLEPGVVSNPNLLDNWYFADPINQRNGYIVDSGVTYYSDTALTASAGTTTEAMTAQYVNSAYGAIVIGGTTYYVAAADVVRGYKNGYTIDRWGMGTLGNGHITIDENGITLTSTEEEIGRNYIDFIYNIEGKAALTGRLVTLSVLTTDGLYHTSVVFGRSAYLEIAQGLSVGISSYVDIFIRVLTGHPQTLVAAKLELDSRQTLAHQDENGNWVLNDPPPNKALELAKCQRYQYVVAEKDITVGTFIQYDPYSAFIFIPLPTSLRALPTVKFEGEFVIPYCDPQGIFHIKTVTFDGINLAPRIANGLLRIGLNSSSFNIPKGSYGWLAVYNPSTTPKFIADSNL